MSDIEQKIRDGTLDDDASIAELWQRYNFFINDAEAPARIKAQGLAIFRAVLFTDTPPASQVSERAVILLRRTLEAIGGLYLAEERRKASIVAVDQAGSAIDPVQLQTRLRSPSLAADLSPSTDIIDLTDDNDMQLDEGFERRERRRTRVRARRTTDKSARDSVLHGLYSHAAPSTISNEVAQTTKPTSASPNATMLPTKSSKYAARLPTPQPNSLIVKLKVRSLNKVIKKSDKAVNTDASKTNAVASATKPRLKRKYQRRFAPKSEEFVTSDLDDDDGREDANDDVGMEDASPAQDEHSRRATLLGKAKKPLGKKKSEGEHESANADLEPKEPISRRKRRKQKPRRPARKRGMKSAEYVVSDTDDSEADPMEEIHTSTSSSHRKRSTRAETTNTRANADAPTTRPETHIPDRAIGSPLETVSPTASTRSWSTIPDSPKPPSPLEIEIRARKSIRPNKHKTQNTSTPSSHKPPPPSQSPTPPPLPTHLTPTTPSTHTIKFPPLPPLPPTKRHPFSLGVSIALSNILDDHRLNPDESLLELITELEDNRPTVEDWERKTILRGAGWVFGACRVGGGLVGENLGDGEGEGEDGEGGREVGGRGGGGDGKDVRGEDIPILVKALEAYFEAEWDKLGWAREREDEGVSDGSSDIWARD